MRLNELVTAMVEDKELLKLKKKELVKMIIQKQFSKEQLEEINNKKFCKFQLDCYEEELMQMSKPLLIYHYLQEN